MAQQPSPEARVCSREQVCIVCKYLGPKGLQGVGSLQASGGVVWENLGQLNGKPSSATGFTCGSGIAHCDPKSITSVKHQEYNKCTRKLPSSQP